MTLTPDRLRYLMNDLGLTERAGARLLGVTYRTMRRWRSGAADIPEGVEGDLASATQDDLDEAMLQGEEG